MALAEFIADVDGNGHGTVVLNGEEISDKLMGFHVFALPDEPTTVVLQVAADVRVSGQGVVEVETPSDVAKAIGGWLSDMDPKKLEAAVMERMEWDEDATFCSILLDILREAADNAVLG